jgi:hypothetical protein
MDLELRIQNSGLSLNQIPKTKYQKPNAKYQKSNAKYQMFIFLLTTDY